MRIRIALAAAVAVTVFPSFLFVSSSSTAATPSPQRNHQAASHGAVRLNLKLTSYSQTQKNAKVAAYVKSVQAQQVTSYLQTVAYLNSVAQAKQQAAPDGSDATSADTAHWACIRQRESGGNYGEGGGGAYQFEFGTWNALTGLPSPAQDYPASVQDSAALKLYSERGFEPWTTRYACGV